MGVIRYAVRHAAHSQPHRPAQRPDRPSTPRSAPHVKLNPTVAPVQDLDALRAWARGQVTPPVLPQEVTEPEVGTQVPETSVKDRPSALSEIVGQEALVNQLRMVIAGSQLRGTKVPHCLLTGPAGHGKTSLASVIAGEIGAELVQTTGVMLKKAGDLIGLLVKASGPTVLFIDEVHALPKPVMETLYTAMEDARVDVLAGSGMETVAYSHALPHLTVCGATTRPGLLSEPFRQRFGFIGQVEAYTDPQLAEIVRRSWEREGAEYAEGEPLEVAVRIFKVSPGEPWPSERGSWTSRP